MNTLPFWTICHFLHLNLQALPTVFPSLCGEQRFPPVSAGHNSALPRTFSLQLVLLEAWDLHFGRDPPWFTLSKWLIRLRQVIGNLKCQTDLRAQYHSGQWRALRTQLVLTKAFSLKMICLLLVLVPCEVLNCQPYKLRILGLLIFYKHSLLFKCNWDPKDEAFESCIGSFITKEVSKNA